MQGILLTNIKFPKNCGECRFLRSGLGQSRCLALTDGDSPGIITEARYFWEAGLHKERSTLCPLVPILSKALVACDIDWDTDGEEVPLPKRLLIPESVDEEDVADFLSDMFGFCIKSLTIKTIGGGEDENIL